MLVQHSSTPIRQPSPFAAWLQLLRFPNLLTVPGDPLAGYLLAAGVAATPDRRIAWAVLASLAFYAGGLIMNDLVDLAVDRVERPRRPLVSGRVRPATARIAMVLLIAAGLSLCAMTGAATWWMGLALCAAIYVYNFHLKATALGPLAMGLCRGASVLVGASLVSTAAPLALSAAAAITAYVCAFTLIARDEMVGVRPVWMNWLPAVVVLLTTGGFVHASPLGGDMQTRLAGVFFLAFSMTGLAAWKLSSGGRRLVPECIGLLISALLALQAAFAIASGAGNLSLAVGLGILLLWPVNRLLARWFAAS